MSNPYHQQRSVIGSAIHNFMERTRRPIREAKAKKKALEAKLKDYDQYEKELKKRGVSKDEAMKNMEWGDRYIDPKKIQDVRAEYKKLYGKTLITDKEK